MLYKFAIISFICMFAAILVVSLLIIVKYLIKIHRSPKITIQAKVLKKYIDEQRVSRKRASGFGYTSRTIRFYYVCFEDAERERLEFRVKKVDYVNLKKGKYGKLTYQGEKYIQFE